MTRARYRAFKCRQGVHRFAIAGVAYYACRDCRTISIPIQPIAPPYDPIELKVGDVFTISGRATDATTGISLRWVKQWDVQLDPMPSFVRYVVPEFAGRINVDGSFTPAPADPMDPTGTLLRRRNVQIGPPGWR